MVRKLMIALVTLLTAVLVGYGYANYYQITNPASIFIPRQDETSEPDGSIAPEATELDNFGEGVDVRSYFENNNIVNVLLLGLDGDEGRNWSVFRTDAITKPLIRQEEEGVKFEAIGEGSETAFKEKKHLYGVSAIRNVGYGYWQQACLVTMT